MWLLNSARLLMLGKKYIKVKDDYETQNLRDFIDIDDSTYNIMSGIPNGSSLDLPADYYELEGAEDEESIDQ